MTYTRETHRGPFMARYPDGRLVAMERDVISISDVQDTILGPMECGRVLMLPWRYVEVEGPRPVVEKLERPRSWLARLLRRWFLT